ncbi:MAG: Superoxide dismutase [Rhodospirillales bacterium]|nr:Superoxide dismutase [Rhodospirillales bacterium]
MAFTLPPLPFAYDALAPHMSKETLEYHHDKHHKTYVETANSLIEGTGLENKSLEEVVIASHKDEKLKNLFNNAAQHWNHSQLWLSMKANSGKIPGEVAKRIDADLGGLDKFKKDFVAEGMAQFGSGWVWLVSNGGKLEIVKTADAENPLVLGKTALATSDVWEHAYYIDYRNEREKYLKTFVDNLINWDRVAELLSAAGQRAAA